MKVTFPKHNFPELPTKKRLFQSSKDQTVINSRIPLIQKYVNELAKIDFVVKSEIFLKWIGPENNVNKLFSIHFPL